MHFQLSRLPRIDFGAGTLQRLPERIRGFGTNALLVTGAQSLQRLPTLPDALARQGITWHIATITGEPSPSHVDEIVRQYRGSALDRIIGIGGGSALDAAKAIAGLLRSGNSVMDHLEGVGPELPYCGPAVPFIAVPTTAGTGSEATKNAVLSTQGEQGFKKSFRDDKLMAEWVILDPDLLATCPPALIAANGMDAFTQLLESYVSLKANPLMDTLARSGMERARDALLPWFENTGNLAEHRANMAYAALLSGITLAHVGLGSVHGLASPLGAFFPIPHGVVCGTLVATATAVNIEVLLARTPNSPALAKYADAGRLLSQNPTLTDAQAHAALNETLKNWTQRLGLPRLGAYGVTAQDIPRIVAHSRGSSMKTNPIVLTDDEIARILLDRL